MNRNSLKRNKFLAAYAKCGVLRKAAEFAGCTRRSHYDWMHDPEYAQQFADAHENAMDLLEEECRRRGAEGWEEPVVYQGGLCYPVVDGKPSKKPLMIRKYDSQLLMFMLKGGRPEKYRDTWKGEIKHSGNVAASVDLSKLSDEHFEQLGAIFEIATRSEEQPGYVNGLSRGEGTAREEPDS